MSVWIKCTLYICLLFIVPSCEDVPCLFNECICRAVIRFTVAKCESCVNFIFGYSDSMPATNSIVVTMVFT
jgi:hypothetical protein